MDPTDTSAASSSPSPSPSPSLNPTPTPAAPKPKPKASPSVWDALAFNGPAPERINGRLAVAGFVAALSLEASRGGGLLSQAGSGAGLTWFLTTAAIFFMASLMLLLQGESAEGRSGSFMSADAEL